MDRLSVEKAALVYFSPHGATKKAAETVAGGIRSAGLHCDYFDASRFIKKGNASEFHVQLSYYKMIVIGTPVYSGHVPEVFRDLLEKIPSLVENQTAAFITAYGGISSGTALYELASIFSRKNYRLLGGIKVAAEHCLMFQSKDPINSGRPGNEDIQPLVAFGKCLVERLTSRERIGYQPRDFMDKSLIRRMTGPLQGAMSGARSMLPAINWDEGLCTRCGDCVSVCPTGNILFDDKLRFFDRCIHCFACVRFCPERSLTAPLDKGEELLLRMRNKLAKHEKGDTVQVV